MTDAPPLLEVTDLVKHFPIKTGVVIDHEVARVRAVDGVSLTINRVEDSDDGCEVWINLIPHTVEVTTLRHLKAGSKVNLEIDLIARYVERILSTSQDGYKSLK